jgi:serine protease
MVRAPEAWSVARGEGVKIAVLDTGIDLNHPDLRSNIARGGIDLVEDDRDPKDMDGHGTHVAGIIAAAANGFGVVGVAPEAKLLPVRVCGPENCPADSIARGIRYAVKRGAAVINLSLGADRVTKEVTGEAAVVRAALTYARREDVVVVASAGNSFLPICDEPAASSLCVGSVDADGNKPLYSNFDATLQVNHLVAPGGGDVPDCKSYILSTFPTGTESVCSTKGYEMRGGTSAAAPFVSGVAALLASQGLVGEQIVQRILATAQDLGSPGRDPIYGYGLVDAAAATDV